MERQNATRYTNSINTRQDKTRENIKSKDKTQKDNATISNAKEAKTIVLYSTKQRKTTHSEM